MASYLIAYRSTQTRKSIPSQSSYMKPRFREGLLAFPDSNHLLGCEADLRIIFVPLPLCVLIARDAAAEQELEETIDQQAPQCPPDRIGIVCHYTRIERFRNKRYKDSGSIPKNCFTTAISATINSRTL